MPRPNDKSYSAAAIRSGIASAGPEPDSVSNLLSSARSIPDPPDLLFGKIGADAGRRQRKNGFVKWVGAA